MNGGGNNVGTATQAGGYAFGQGGNHSGDGGGGGGGYYGGYAASGDFGGGGGSSFVSGLAGCNAVNSAGALTGQPKHFSGLVFRNARTVAGGGSAGAGSITVVAK